MLLLHALVVGTIAAATLLLLSRVLLAHVAAHGYDTDQDRWIGARSHTLASFLWIGPLVIGRHPAPGAELVCDRFHGDQGPARTVGVVFGGVQWVADMHHHTARGWMLLPNVLMAGFLGYAAATALRNDLHNAFAVVACLFVANLCVMRLVHYCDVLATDLHYAHSGAELGEHEAFERGRNDGIRYEVETQRFRTGQRHEAPAYPANPYAA